LLLFFPSTSPFFIGLWGMRGDSLVNCVDEGNNVRVFPWPIVLFWVVSTSERPCEIRLSNQSLPSVVFFHDLPRGSLLPPVSVQPTRIHFLLLNQRYLFLFQKRIIAISPTRRNMDSDKSA
jgi:hypothetical protein